MNIPYKETKITVPRSLTCPEQGRLQFHGREGYGHFIHTVFFKKILSFNNLKLGSKMLTFDSIFSQIEKVWIRPSIWIHQFFIAHAKVHYNL